MSTNGPPAGNLTKEHPPEIMARWRGCADRGCLPECNAAELHCARLAAFMRLVNEERTAP